MALRDVRPAALGLPASDGTSAPPHHDDEAAPSLSIAVQAGRGVVARLARQLAGYAVNFIASVVLARILLPRDFGIYVIGSFVVTTAFRVTNTGLGSALIHQDDTPSLTEMRAVFTFQSLIAIVSVAIVTGFALGAARFLRLDAEAAWLLPLMAAPMATSALVTNSRVMLARHLRFGTLASIDVIETLVYQTIVICLAFAQFGYWSFGYAAVLAGIVGQCLVYIAAPWPVGFAWNAEILRRTIGFGARFQLSGLSSTFRDNVVSLLGGPLFGPAAVGYLHWGQANAERFGHAVTQAVTEVAFPALCRARHDSRTVTAMVERMISYPILVTAPCLAITAALLPQIITVVYTSKWLPAGPAYYCFAFGYLLANVTTPLDAYLKASGRVDRSMKIMWGLTVLQWVLALAGVSLFGLNGIALSFAGASAIGACVLYRVTGGQARLRVARFLMPPAAAASVAGLGTWAVASLGVMPNGGFSVVELMALAILGTAAYVTSLAIVGGRRLGGQALRDFLLLAQSHRVAAPAVAHGATK